MGLLIKGDWETEKGQFQQIYLCIENFSYRKAKNQINVNISYWPAHDCTKDGTNSIINRAILYEGKKEIDISFPANVVIDLHEEVSAMEPIYEVREVTEEVPYISFDENGDEVTKYREILTEQKIQINEEKVTKKVKNIDIIKEDIFKTIYNKIEIELYKIYNFKEIINK